MGAFFSLGAQELIILLVLGVGIVGIAAVIIVVANQNKHKDD